MPLDHDRVEMHREAIARAFSLFEWRLQTSGDIADWRSHHQSCYTLCRYEELPAIVLQEYCRIYNRNEQGGPVSAKFELVEGLSLYD